MADFGTALKFMLPNEGGLVYSNTPGDAGGQTFAGITEAVARANGYTGDMHSIPFVEVAAIYLKNYWKYNGIHDQAVADKLFDMGVNMGVGEAIRLLQEALNDLGASLTVDGGYGPVTESTLNALAGAQVVSMLCQISDQHYQDIVAKNPGDAKFLKGWEHRAEEVPTDE